MKNQSNSNARKICTQLLVASFIFAISVDAQAKKCKWYDAPCKARQAAEKVAREAQHAAQQAAQQAAAAAKKIAAAGAAISSSEMNSLRSAATASYSQTRGALNSAYAKAVAELKAIYNAALEALFREAGKAFMDTNKDFLTKLFANMRNLDADGKAALNRIRRAIPTKQMSDQTRNDMVTLGQKLGLMAGQKNSLDNINRSPLRVFAESLLELITGQANAVPGNVSRSSWGVYITGGGSAVAGGSESFALIMNTFLQDGKYYFGFAESTGASIGLQEGATAEGGIFWSPGSIDNAAGSSVGFGAGGALGVGASVALSWSVSGGMSGAYNGIPGFSIGFDAGEKVEVAFQSGHTVLIAKF